MKHETDFKPTDTENVSVPRAALLRAAKLIDFAASLAAKNTNLISLAMLDSIDSNDSQAVASLRDDKSKHLQSLSAFYDDAKRTGQALQDRLDESRAAFIAGRARITAARILAEQKAKANGYLADALTDLALEAHRFDAASPVHLARFLTIYRLAKEITATEGFFPPLGAALAISAARIRFMQHIQAQYDELAEEAEAIRSRLPAGCNAVGAIAYRMKYLRARLDDLAAEMNALDGAITVRESTATH